jgi:hypothetical protein
MTTQEFSTAFDTLLNTYNSSKPFGEAASNQEITLDEYEKSIFLTLAQDLVIKEYFDSTLNSSGQGFDTSSRRQLEFSSLIVTKELDKAQDDEENMPVMTHPNGVFYKFPKDALFIINERILVDGKYHVIVPINYDNFNRIMSKTYTQPLKKQCWRIINSVHLNDEVLVEIVAPKLKNEDPEVSEYIIRYIKQPSPIVLVDLSADGLDINGVRIVSECTVSKNLHQDILKKAVELAISSKGSYADFMKKIREDYIK